jgi:hypothetical protein
MPRPPQPHRSAAPKRRRLRAVLAGSIAAAALIAGISTVAVAVAPDDDQVVATIDGADVTRGELLFHARLVRAAVDNAAIDDATDLNSADQRTADDRAAALREAALDEIRHDRALLALGRERGLTDLESFADLEAAAESTNATRARQVAEGELVYGLTEFTLDEFRSRTMTDLRTRLTAALTSGQAPELVITDAEVETFLAEHADEWAAGASTYRVTRLSIPASAGLDAARVAELAASPGGLEQAAAAVPGASTSPVLIDAEGRIKAGAGAEADADADADADAETATGPSLSPDAIGQLRSLAPDESTDPQTDRGGWAVYRLDEASVDTAAALATYASRIRAVLVDERVDALLAERVAEQRTEISQSEWNAVNMEGITR